MSLMDKIKEMFSGGSADRKDEHDHSGHDHAGHDHEPAAPMPPTDSTGMSAAPGSVSMPETEEPERRDDL